MKAVQIKSTHEIGLVDIQRPEIKDNELLLKIGYVGFCGSDLNTYRGANAMVEFPRIPGHEIGATISEVGSSVPSHLKVGMVVTVNPYTNCGKCSSCRNGRVNACQDNQTLGVQRDGAMCEYIAIPWEKVIPAEGIGEMESALIEPMSVGFHAVSRGAVTDIDNVLVIGCGMIGVGAIVRASMRGANVIAMDLDDEKLELARQLGARYTINSNSDDVHAKLQEITGGFGPDVIIEAVGSPITYQTAINEVAFTGRVVCIGYSKQDVTFQTKYFVQKELDIRGSRNAMPSDFRAVINYLRSATTPYQKVITSVIAPDETAEALAKWDANPGKVFRILVKF